MTFLRCFGILPRVVRFDPVGRPMGVAPAHAQPDWRLMTYVKPHRAAEREVSRPLAGTPGGAGLAPQAVLSNLITRIELTRNFIFLLLL